MNKSLLCAFLFSANLYSEQILSVDLLDGLPSHALKNLDISLNKEIDKSMKFNELTVLMGRIVYYSPETKGLEIRLIRDIPHYKELKNLVLKLLSFEFGSPSSLRGCARLLRRQMNEWYYDEHGDSLEFKIQLSQQQKQVILSIKIISGFFSLSDKKLSDKALMSLIDTCNNIDEFLEIQGEEPSSWAPKWLNKKNIAIAGGTVTLVVVAYLIKRYLAIDEVGELQEILKELKPKVEVRLNVTDRIKADVNTDRAAWRRYQSLKYLYEEKEDVPAKKLITREEMLNEVKQTLPGRDKTSKETMAAFKNFNKDEEEEFYKREKKRVDENVLSGAYADIKNLYDISVDGYMNSKNTLLSGRKIGPDLPDVTLKSGVKLQFNDKSDEARKYIDDRNELRKYESLKHLWKGNKVITRKEMLDKVMQKLPTESKEKSCIRADFEDFNNVADDEFYAEAQAFVAEKGLKSSRKEYKRLYDDATERYKLSKKFAFQSYSEQKAEENQFLIQAKKLKKEKKDLSSLSNDVHGKISGFEPNPGLRAKERLFRRDEEASAADSSAWKLDGFDKYVQDEKDPNKWYWPLREGEKERRLKYDFTETKDPLPDLDKMGFDLHDLQYLEQENKRNEADAKVKDALNVEKYGNSLKEYYKRQEELIEARDNMKHIERNIEWGIKDSLVNTYNGYLTTNRIGHWLSTRKAHLGKIPTYYKAIPFTTPVLMGLGGILSNGSPAGELIGARILPFTAWLYESYKDPSKIKDLKNILTPDILSSFQIFIDFLTHFDQSFWKLDNPQQWSGRLNKIRDAYGLKVWQRSFGKFTSMIFFEFLGFEKEIEAILPISNSEFLESFIMFNMSLYSPIINASSNFGSFPQVTTYLKENYKRFLAKFMAGNSLSVILAKFTDNSERGEKFFNFLEKTWTQLGILDKEYAFSYNAREKVYNLIAEGRMFEAIDYLYDEVANQDSYYANKIYNLGDRYLLNNENIDYRNIDSLEDLYNNVIVRNFEEENAARIQTEQAAERFKKLVSDILKKKQELS